MTGPRSALAMAATMIALLTAACTPGAGASAAPQPGEGVDWVSQAAGANAIVEARVVTVGEAPDGEIFAGAPLVRLAITKPLWQAELVPEARNERFPAELLHPAETIDVIEDFPTGALDQLVPGETYVFFLSYAYHAKTDPFWTLSLVVHPDGTLLPAYDTEVSRNVLAAVLAPGETRSDVIDALIEYTEQTRAELTGHRPPATSSRTSRVAALYQKAAEERTAPTAVPPPPDEAWKALPPERRYLPADPVDTPPWIEDAVGAHLVPYEILVIHDDTLPTGVESLSLLFDDVGLLGRHVVDHATGITAISGMAPADTPARLVAWTAGALDAAPDRTLAPLSPLRLLGPDGTEITAIIDLRGDTPWIRTLTRDAFDTEILRLQDRLSRQTGDPNDPEPGS